MKALKTSMLAVLVLLIAVGITIGLIGVPELGVKAADDNIQSDKAKTINAYNGAKTTSAIEATFDLSIHMHFGAPFNSLSISMPTWGTAGSSCTIGIYEWEDSYLTTIQKDPLATKNYSKLADNATNTFKFDEVPAGEYLIRIYNVKGRVGVWAYEKDTSKGYTYIGGNEAEYDWKMAVGFTKTPKDPFFAVESDGDALEKGNVKAPAEYEIPEDSLLNTHNVQPSTWVFTDGLGRVSLTNAEVGDVKDDKTLAMFYWTWHAALSTAGYKNTSEIMAKYPEAKNDYNHKAWKEGGTYCFWNEPIYGYYRTDDEWVLRRQAELLANAGVDVIFADNTNGSATWSDSYKPLMNVWSDAQQNGAVNVPKVSFLLPFGANSGSRDQAVSLFYDIYATNQHQNLWFYLNGKPMLMAHSSNLPKTIQRYFVFRGGQPLYKVNSTTYGQWGWLSTFPQALYYTTKNAQQEKNVEQMSVGIAMNHNYKTGEITAMNGQYVMGRSYTSTYPDRYEKEGSEASKWGYNFAEQFNYALEVDPQVIFVTGWNEWHAFRQTEPWGGSNSLVDNALVDQFDDEFSRDIEPTKGPLKDHYYYQLVNFSRQYQGAEAIPVPTGKISINLSGDTAQWNNVGPYYAAYIGNTEDRKANGYGTLKYTERSGRNDIIGAQIARDDAFVYFLVECAEDITPYTDKLWMNLYLDTDQGNQGWNTFEYVINKSPAGEKTLVLEKFTATDDYAKTEKVADVEYTVSGRYMTVKIAKESIGLSGDDYTINFTWTDNVHDEGKIKQFSGDIMDFYISGDVAPGGRFKYSYISTSENASAPVEGVTSADTTVAVDEEKKGCFSSILLSPASMVILVPLGVLALKKRRS